MQHLKQELERETKSQLQKLKKLFGRLNVKNSKGKEMLKNIAAYMHDCEHFLKTGKLILAFEAIVWAWAWVEIGKWLDMLKQK